MQYAFFILVGAAIAASATAQDSDAVGGITAEFSVGHSPCVAKHDPAVEKAFQAAVTVEAARPPETGSVVMAELRNSSRKTITAYVLTYTVKRGGRTDYYSGLGKDFVYEMAVAQYSKKPTPPNSTLRPGEVYRTQLGRGKTSRAFEVYPCMVAFDDGTGIGPASVLTMLMRMRSDNAKLLGELIADLELARDSGDPRAALLVRAKRLKQNWGTVTHARYLEAEASQLSKAPDASLDRKRIAGDIAVLRAQKEALLEHSVASNPK